MTGLLTACSDSEDTKSVFFFLADEATEGGAKGLFRFAKQEISVADFVLRSFRDLWDLVFRVTHIIYAELRTQAPGRTFIAPEVPFHTPFNAHAPVQLALFDQAIDETLAELSKELPPLPAYEATGLMIVPLDDRAKAVSAERARQQAASDSTLTE
jgi:hypothetical protein